MSAAAPVVTKQLEPGMECERCASMNFPEHKPAVAIHNGIAVCRRCDNLYRAQAQARSAPAQIPDADMNALSEVVLVPKAPATATLAPRILSKQDYLEQFGPANNDDLVKSGLCPQAVGRGSVPADHDHR